MMDNESYDDMDDTSSISINSYKFNPENVINEDMSSKTAPA